jgi:hypothetical protein
MSTRRSYEYTSLTAAIADRISPLRRYLDARFPHKKTLQAIYRARRSPLLVAGGTANPATLGAAFDFATRFVLDPEHIPRVALAAFQRSGRRSKALLEIVEIAKEASDCRSDLAPEDLLRAAWVLALTTEVFRSGNVRQSPLSQLGWLNFTPRRLLELAPRDALIQMQRLHSVATVELFPHLPHAAKRLAMGPTFDASVLCSADADFIIDGHLVELKTRLGSVSKSTGNRFDSIPGQDINQLLAYTLFDRSDRYRMNKVSLYSARYGTLTTWPLVEFMEVLGDRSVDLMQERESVWRILSS